MISLLMAFAALFLELNLFFICGTILRRIPFMPSSGSTASNVLWGFTIYHFLFWIMAYACKRLLLPFHIVFYAWVGILLILPAVLLILFRKDIAVSYSRARSECSGAFLYFLMALAAVLLLVFYAVTHGQIDVDSYTYIGEVTTYLHKDVLSGVRVATGLIDKNPGDELRRGFSLFGAESACWCRLLGMEALIYCRYTRTALQLFLYAIALFSCARIWRPAKDAFLFVAAIFSFLPLFAENIYQPASFLLNRGYEGKAWLAGFLLALVFYYIAQYINTDETGYIPLLFAANIACLNISASAVYVIPPVIIVLFGVHAIASRRIRDLICLPVLFLPNLYFLLQYVGG